MALLTGAKVGSLWKLRNGCVARLEERSKSQEFLLRSHYFTIIEVPLSVSTNSTRVYLDTGIHRMANGNIDEGEDKDWGWSVVEPVRLDTAFPN